MPVDVRTEVLYGVVSKALDYRRGETIKNGSAPYPINAVSYIVAEDAAAKIKGWEESVLKIDPSSPPTLDHYLQYIKMAGLQLPFTREWGAILGGALINAVEDGIWKGWEPDVIAAFYNQRADQTNLPRLNSVEVGDATYLLCCKDQIPFTSRREQDKLLSTRMKPTMGVGKYPDVEVFFASRETLREIPPLAGALESLLPAIGILEESDRREPGSEVITEQTGDESEITLQRNELRAEYRKYLTTTTLARARFIHQAAKILLTQI